MANCFLGVQNRIDESTLSGGAWSSTLPLTMLKTSIITDVARSVNALTTSTQFVIALTKARLIKCISLIGHNMLPSTAPMFRIRGYSDAGLTTQLYDSGTLPVWSRTYPTTALNWEDSNFWDGLPQNEDVSGYTFNVSHILSTMTVAQYWKIELIDSTNSAGYVQLGRVFISGGWQPLINMSVGASIGWETTTRVSRARAGAKYFDVKPQYRVARFSLDNMSVDEGYASAFDIKRVSGLDKEVYFIYDPANTLHQYRWSFIGTLRELSPIEQPYNAQTKTSFAVEENL